MPEETVETPVENAPPEDYAAYEEWAAKQNMQPGNVERADDDVEEDETDSEAAETQAETAEESETSETKEQEEEDEEEDDDEEEPEDKPKGKGVQKRISKLTQKIRDLEQRLAAGEKKEPEVAEPEAAEKQDKPDDGKPVAPKLADFESYELYEAAHAEFVDKLTDWKADQKETARKAEAEQEALKAAQAEHQAEWDKAASRFDDFDDVVGSEDVKISQAMQSVLKSMEPEVGTALAYHLAKHPEESLRIAKATLADNEQQWRAALAKAGRELGKLEDKLEAPKGEKKPSAPAPKKETPKVTAAPKPPAKVAGTRAAGMFDVQEESTAEDYESWVRARNKQLKNR